MRVLVTIMLAASLGAAAGAPLEDDGGLAEVLRQGIMLFGQGKLDLASREFNRVLRFDPSNRIALHHMARIHAAQGRLMKAIDTIRLLQELGVAVRSDNMRETIYVMFQGILAEKDLKARADLLVHLRETLVGLSGADNRRVDVHLMCLYAKLGEEQLYKVARSRYFGSSAPTPELYVAAGLRCIEYNVTLGDAVAYFSRAWDLLEELGRKLTPSGNAAHDLARRTALAARRSVVANELAYACHRLGWHDPERNRVVASEAKPDVTFVEMKELPQVGGRGLAVGDYDGDGYEDLCVGGHILRNQGGARFEDVTDKTGVRPDAAALPLWLDCDGDGRLDLLFAGVRHLTLWRNYGGGTFVDATAAWGLAFPMACLPGGAAAADWDNDGKLDLFIGGFEVPGRIGTACPNFLLRNVGGRFVDVAARAGLRERGFFSTRAAAWCDFNGNGLMDLYVANGRLQPNQLWVNQGNGRFLELADTAGVRGTTAQVRAAGMFGNSVTCEWGDVNGDGELDLVVAEATALNYAGKMDSGAVYLNGYRNGGKRFVNHIARSNLAFEEMPTGATLADFDNDGDLDTCRTEEGERRALRLYANDGAATFHPVTWRAGLIAFDLQGHAWFDKDNDGDLDLVATGKQVRLFENNGNDNAWLRVSLEGTGGNTKAVGGRVTVQLPDNRTRLVRDVTAGTGSGAQGSSVVHFGLGKHGGLVRVSVRWPQGAVQQIEGARTRRHLVVKQQ